MAEPATILQHWIVTSFILPFLLLFFIIFGILQKSKLFGDAKQLNAFIAFVVGLIFVGAAFPKLAVNNLILFLTVAVVVMFVVLILWGFVAGEDGLKFEKFPKPIKYLIGSGIIAALIIVMILVTGIQNQLIDLLFKQSWSKEFWTNFAFIAVVIIALGAILNTVKPK